MVVLALIRVSVATVYVRDGIVEIDTDGLAVVSDRLVVVALLSVCQSPIEQNDAYSTPNERVSGIFLWITYLSDHTVWPLRA